MILGATGHQEMPDVARAHARREIAAVVSKYAPRVRGACSLAAGADQMFAEIILRLGGELQVIIPSSGYESTFADHESRTTYEALLARAQTVEQLPHPTPTEDAFLDAGRHVVDLSDELVAVWDGVAARGRGGTADIVAYARAAAKPVHVIWPAGVHR